MSSSGSRSFFTRKYLRYPLVLAAVMIGLACSGSPAKPPCDSCQPWTPSPIPRPATSTSASAPTAMAPVEHH